MMSNTPKLRFPEFYGEWKDKKLSDIIKLVEETVGDDFSLIE